MKLAVLVCQVKGVRVNDVSCLGTRIGERVSVSRGPNRFDIHCLDVRLWRGRLLLGHVEASVAALLSPLIRDLNLEVVGYVFFAHI